MSIPLLRCGIAALLIAFAPGASAVDFGGPPPPRVIGDTLTPQSRVLAETRRINVCHPATLQALRQLFKPAPAATGASQP